MSTKPLSETNPDESPKIIDVRPSRKFGGSWLALESPGVEPAYVGPAAREQAIGYARQRFGGSSGEVRPFDQAGTITETLPVNGRDLYPHAV